MIARGLRAALPLVVLLGVLGASRPARALPVFARRYATSCSTCHVQFPKLNAFGEAFRRNGYQMPGGADAQAIAEKPVTLVADAYRELFPRSFWPSDIPSVTPFAFAIDSALPIFPDAQARPVGQQAISFDQLYARAEVLVGARLGKDVAVYGEININTASGIELQRGFMTISNLFGQSVLHLRIGQFEPQLFSFSEYRKIAGPGYQLLGSTIAHSHWNFEFVRGLNLSGTIGGRFGWDAAYVQGVEGSYAGDGIRQLPRDGYLHLYAKIGGMRLDGIEKKGGPAAVAGPEQSLTVGGFVYGGKHDVETQGDPAVAPEGDVLLKAGGDLYAEIGRVSLLGAAAYEMHRFDLTAHEWRVQALAEATVVIVPWLSAVARGEMSYYQGAYAYRLTPVLSVLPRINLKLQAWVVFDQPLTGGSIHFTEVDVAGRFAF